MARPNATDPRSKQLKARFTEAELHSVAQRAEHTGVTVSELLRFGVLHEPPPPRRRGVHPVKDQQELARILGAVGKIGSNVNQLAHVANCGSWPESRLLHEAAADIQWMRRALMLALGVHDEPKHPAP